MKEKLVSLDLRLKNLERQVVLLDLHKPLSKQEVRGLVAEIAKQPKEIEEQALGLLAKLEAQIKRVDQLVESLVLWTGAS